MVKYSFGLRKSPLDERDFLMRSFLDDKPLPPKFDLTDEMTKVRSQGNEGACVGFAMAVGVKERQELVDYGHYVVLSPRYLYELAKKISGHKEGTTLRAVVQVAKNMGVCEESFWPYIAKDPSGRKAGADKNAGKHKIKTYARIANLDELKRAIVDPKVGAVIIGVKVYNGMVSAQAKETGVTPNPSCWNRKVLGGHAITACGYNDDSPYYKKDGHIKCKGSWGEEYGDKGYHYLSYKYIKANMLDAFSSIDIVGSAHIAKVIDLNLVERNASWV